MSRLFRLNDHLVALTAAFALHGGVAAWAMHEPGAIHIQPQAIHVSMVAPSQPEPIKTQAKPEAPIPISPPKPDGLKKKTVKKQQQQEKKTVEKKIIAPPTSGPQAPDATEKIAARSEPIFNAAYLHNPPPVYPPSARRKGVQGKVMLKVDVSKEGSAREVSVAHSSGSLLLDNAALGAVKRWRFVPAKQGSEIIEAQVLVPVEFKLN